MTDYVAQQWRTTYVEKTQGTAGRVAAWVLGVIAVVAIAAFATKAYWYPYAAQWW